MKTYEFDFSSLDFDDYAKYLNRRIILDELFDTHDLSLSTAGERDAIKRGPYVWMDYIGKRA